MKIEVIEINKIKIASVISDEILIKNAQDGLNLLGELYYQQFDKIIIQEKNITPDFFDLKNGIAGEILQKFSNYRVQLAIVGDFSNYSRKSIIDFMTESNRLGHINFVKTIEEAKERLLK